MQEGIEQEEFFSFEEFIKPEYLNSNKIPEHKIKKWENEVKEELCKKKKHSNICKKDDVIEKMFEENEKITYDPSNLTSGKIYLY